jgi:TonB family protein
VSVYVPPESLLESKAFRRLLALSLAGHVAIFVAFTFRPRGHAMVISPSPVMVNVVQAPPPQAKPAPAPKAAPKPPQAKPPEPKPPEPEPPPPPKPVVNEVVIPKEVAPLKPEKPKAKPAPKPEPRPKTAEELLAELTQKVETEHPDSVPDVPAQTEPAPPAPIAGGVGTFDPLLSPWVRHVQSFVQSNWSGAQLCKGMAKFNVDVGAGGELSGIELAESSGDRFCDEAAERALRKSNPLPAPPRGAMSILLELSQKGTL